MSNIDKFRSNLFSKAVLSHQMKELWKTSASEHSIEIWISGIDPMGHFEFKYAQPLVLKTLFTQTMLEKGVLGTNAFYASCAHKSCHLDSYAEAIDEAFEMLAKAIEEGKPEKYLKGPVCHAGFKRLT